MNDKTAKRSLLKRALYAVSALLVLFYVLILILSLKPKVGIEYEMYYLTHELKEWPGYGNLTCEWGKKEYFTENTFRNNKYVNYDVGRRRAKGWHTSGRYEGTWSNNSKESILYYIFPEDCNKLTFSISINDYLTSYGYVSPDSDLTMEEAALLCKQRFAADKITAGNIETAIIAATDEGNSHRSWVFTIINRAKEAKEKGEEPSLLYFARSFPSKSARRAAYTGVESVAPSTDGTCAVRVYLDDYYLGTFNQPGDFEFSLDADIKKDQLYQLRFVPDKKTSFSLWTITVNNE